MPAKYNLHVRVNPQMIAQLYDLATTHGDPSLLGDLSKSNLIRWSLARLLQKEGQLHQSPSPEALKWLSGGSRISERAVAPGGASSYEPATPMFHSANSVVQSAMEYVTSKLEASVSAEMLLSGYAALLDDLEPQDTEALRKWLTSREEASSKDPTEQEIIRLLGEYISKAED